MLKKYSSELHTGELNWEKSCRQKEIHWISWLCANSRTLTIFFKDTYIIMCHVSCVMFCFVTCHLLLTPKGTDPPPAKFPTSHSRLVCKDPSPKRIWGLSGYQPVVVEKIYKNNYFCANCFKNIFFGGWWGFWVSKFMSLKVPEFPSLQVSKFLSFQVFKWDGAREEGRTNERPGNWSCDLRANERPPMMAHTDTQTDMATLWMNWHSGASSVKNKAFIF